MWVHEYINRHEIVDALTSIRKEWEQAADGKDITTIQGNVDLILVDFAETLGLIDDEIKAVLGQPILNERSELDD